jgi:ribosomal protein S18 acetylase RimI-like enzyme
MIAVEEGAETVALTSRPEREAANRLYRRLGFVRRETNVYVWRPEYPARP